MQLRIKLPYNFIHWIFAHVVYTVRYEGHSATAPKGWHIKNNFFLQYWKKVDIGLNNIYRHKNYSRGHIYKRIFFFPGSAAHFPTFWYMTLRCSAIVIRGQEVGKPVGTFRKDPGVQFSPWTVGSPSQMWGGNKRRKVTVQTQLYLCAN